MLASDNDIAPGTAFSYKQDQIGFPFPEGFHIRMITAVNSHNLIGESGTGHICHKDLFSQIQLSAKMERKLEKSEKPSKSADLEGYGDL